MGHIFISYTKKDVNLCAEMAKHLRAAGLEVWYDVNLPMGRNYAPIIEEKLRTAEAVITLWTKRSVRSKWVYFETELAYRMAKLVPVRLERCELPSGLDGVQTYDFDAKAASPAAWDTLLGYIRTAVDNGRENQDSVDSLDELVWRKTVTSRDPKDFSDFLVRYEKSPHADEARALLKKTSRNDGIRRTLWFVIGVIIYVALLTPLFSLVHDFGSAGAWFWITLYFHYFAFFATFGAMMVPIYCFTLAKALDYGFHRAFFRPGTGLAKAATLTVMCIAPAMACAVVTSMETSDGYAPWQFTEKVLSAPVRTLAPIDSDRSLEHIFSDARDSDLKSLWALRNDDPAAAGHCLITGKREAPGVCLTMMKALQVAMERRMRTDPASLSATNTAYVYSFFFFALTFLGSYFNIFFLCFRSQKVRTWMAGLAPWGGQRYGQLLWLFAVQLLFIAVWFVARIIFQLETATILNADSGVNYNAVIRNSYFGFVAVYFVSIGFVVAAALRLQNALTRAGIVILAGLTALYLGMSFSVTAFCRSMQAVIGGRAGPASLFVLMVLLVFVIFIPLVLPNLLPRDEDDING